jgi:dienelactone hydrolase
MNCKSFSFLLLFSSLFILLGCHGRSSSVKENDNSYLNSDSGMVKHIPAPKTALPKGRVIDSIKCADNSTQIYSLYLPTAYDSSKKWPVIYFFDPHGVGNLPVTFYKDLAEKYGYILAGTYNSKNGMTFEASHKAALEFMRDSYERLSIDNNRVYTFGFSGGAKVASALALTDGGISGVVMCGGGFPEKHPEITQPFSCISFVGDRDFNYVEVKELDKLLDTTSINHQVIVFHGKHQWAPTDVIEQAFQWLNLNAMKAKYIPKDSTLINYVKRNMLKNAEKLHIAGKKTEEYYAYKKMLNFLRDLTDMGKYATRMQALQSSDIVQKYIKDEQTFDEQEVMEQQEFINDMKKKDITWWENKIGDMKGRIKKDSNSPSSLVEQRVLGLLSLFSYMNASGAFTSKQYKISSHFVELYAIVDPSNPEHSYLSACLDANENNSSKALTDLGEAVKLGFNDLHRLQQDSNFVAFHNMKEYKELVKKISSKPEKLDLTQ